MRTAEEIVKTIRFNIPEIAYRKRISMRQVCREGGLHHMTVSKFINGKSDMTLGMLCKVADGLGVSFDTLIRKLPNK